MFRYPDKPRWATAGVLPVLKDEEWLAQFKADGWRAVVTLQPDTVQLLSRHNLPLPASERLLETAARTLRAAGVPVGSVLDGEWMGRRDQQPEGLYLFDLLQWGESWIGLEATSSRFCRLREVLAGHETAEVRLIPWATSRFMELFSASRQVPGMEGIVLKRATAPFIGSLRRSVDNPHWMKVRWR